MAVNTENVYADETGVWAYLHHELDAAERLAFEHRLADDGALRERCAEARRLDNLLRKTLPVLDHVDLSGEALCNRALAAWERDQEETAAAPERSAPRFAVLRFHGFKPAVAGLAGLVAAALIVMTVLPAFRAPPVETYTARWAPVEFVPLVTRGSDVAGGSSNVDARDAQRMRDALADSFAWALADCGGTLPGNPILSMRFRELRDGAFAATVRAEASDGRLLGEWSGDYSGIERFIEQADASAAHMAEVLSVPAATSD